MNLQRQEPPSEAQAAPVAANAPVREGDVIDVSRLLREILRRWWVLVIFAAIGVYQGYRNLSSFTPQYEARMIVAPTGAQSSSASGFRGIASTIGLQVQSAQEVTPFDRLKVLVGSVSFAKRMQERHGLLQVIYAASWDAGRGTWVRPQGDSFERSQKIRAFLRQPTWSPPSIEGLANNLGGSLQFNELKDSPFQVVSSRDADRDKALERLRLIYFEADDMLREMDQVSSDQRRAYLLAQLQGVSRQFLRDVLLSLLAQEEQKAMLLQGDLPYAARIVEPPFVSAVPSSPNMTTLVIGPVLALLAVGILLVSLYAFYRWENR